MLRQTFHFREDPFGSEPDPRFLYLDAARHRALATLIAAVSAGRSPVCLSGADGFGKTILLRKLAFDLAERGDIGLLAPDGVLTATPDATCAGMVGELRAAWTADKSRARERRATENALEGDADGEEEDGPSPALSYRRHALLVDDADRLAPAVLAELISWAAAPQNGHGAIILVVAGTQDLMARGPLAREATTVTAAGDELPCQVVLGALETADVGAMVRHRLAVAGFSDETLFSPLAMARLAHHGCGSPRTVVRLCASALVNAGIRARAKHTITGHMIDRAAHRLNLPTASISWSLTTGPGGEKLSFPRPAAGEAPVPELAETQPAMAEPPLADPSQPGPPVLADSAAPQGDQAAMATAPAADRKEAHPAGHEIIGSPSPRSPAPSAAPPLRRWAEDDEGRLEPSLATGLMLPPSPVRILPVPYPSAADHHQLRLKPPHATLGARLGMMALAGVAITTILGAAWYMVPTLERPDIAAAKTPDTAKTEDAANAAADSTPGAAIAPTAPSPAATGNEPTNVPADQLATMVVAAGGPNGSVRPEDTPAPSAGPAPPESADAAAAPANTANPANPGGSQAASPASPERPPAEPLAAVGVGEAGPAMARSAPSSADEPLRPSAAEEPPALAGAVAIVQAVPAPAAGPPVANAKASDLDPDGLIARGDEFLKIGDVASARLFYRLAANLGSARGAGALGWTFDPHYLEKAGITGVQPSPGDAMEWYRKAMALGDRDATNRFLVLVERLEKKAAQGDSEAKQLLEKLR